MSDSEKEHAKPNNDKKEQIYQLINESLPDELKQEFIQKVDELSSQPADVLNIREYMEHIQSPEHLDIYYGLNRVRKILCQEFLAAPNEQLIQIILDQPAIDKICEIALSHELNILVFEALWIITNIGYGDHNQIRQIINRKGIQIIAQAVHSKYSQIVELAAWCIGNFSADCSEFRDLLVEADVIRPLLKFAKSQQKVNFEYYKNAVWASTNIVRTQPTLKGKKVASFPRFFSDVILENDDPEILRDSCWALSKLSDTEQQLNEIKKSCLLPKLVQLLTHADKKLKIPSLRIIGNFLTGNDTQTDYVLNHGILKIFEQLLDSPEKVILKEVCWSISNIAAGNKSQVQQILKNDSLLLKLFTLVNQQNFEVNKEINWIFSNVFNHGDKADLDYAINLGLLKQIKLMFNLNDKGSIIITLTGLEKLLSLYSNSDEKSLQETFIELGLTEEIEKLQLHQDMKVYEKALKILETYFNVEEI